MRVAVIGCGNMGSILAGHFAKRFEVILCDHKFDHAKKLAKSLGGRAAQSIGEIEADVVVLAVKPDQYSQVAGELKVRDDMLIASVLGGVKVSDLEQAFEDAQIVRLMPSVTLKVGRGVMSVVFGDSMKPEGKERTLDLVEGVGEVAIIPESKMDAMTILCGSGPAFASIMIGGMIEGGIAMGLKAEDAKKYAIETVIAAAQYLDEERKTPQAMRWEISSPGGTTIAGIVEMELKGARSAMIQGLLAGFEHLNGG